MYIGLLCEGNSEVQLMQYLLDKNALIFSKEQIIDRRPIHARQGKKIKPIIDSMPIDVDIVLYRIGDTLKEKFDLSCFGEKRKSHITIIDINTKPEIEILIIIKEGLYNEYLKLKSKIKPKQFIKQYLKEYSNFNDYLLQNNLILAIKEYKRLKHSNKNNRNNIFLADIINYQ